EELAVRTVEVQQVFTLDAEDDGAVSGVGAPYAGSPAGFEEQVQQEQGVAGLGGHTRLARDRYVSAFVAVDEAERDVDGLVGHVQAERQPFVFVHLVEEQ